MLFKEIAAVTYSIESSIKFLKDGKFCAHRTLNSPGVRREHDIRGKGNRQREEISPPAM